MADLADPQLFDLEADPEELHDLAADPAHAATLTTCRALLEAELDPKATHERALADQRRRIDELGGEAAIIARGDYGFSPPPGVAARFS